MAKLIPLHGQHGKGKFAIVDDEDYELVNKYHWIGHKGQSGIFYAIAAYGGRKQHKVVLMHRLITNASSSVMIDHDNGDGIDNQKHNLRPCTNSQNQANAKRRKGSSRYRGIYRKNQDATRWAAHITVNGKTIHLGCFYTEIEAARAYDKAARFHFGEFARLNLPDE